MEKRLKSIVIDSSNSSYYIHLCKQDSGEHFLELEQVYRNQNQNSSIKIDPNKLRSIITTLENLNTEIEYKNNKILNPEISFEEQQKIVFTYLKGISIKDLSLQFRIDGNIIKEILLKNEVVIIEENQIKHPKQYWKKR